MYLQFQSCFITTFTHPQPFVYVDILCDVLLHISQTSYKLCRLVGIPTHLPASSYFSFNNHCTLDHLSV